MSVKFSQNNQFVIEEVEENTDEISLEDANRFKTLCDGVTNCMALVQSSHSELMDFKSLLLQENVAPSLQVKLVLITGMVFRSVSDLHNPLGELVRLVKIYSESWEKKSEALRRLHKHYEVKSGQLNVALKRLAIQNEETRRVRKKEILQNWELLFSRVQMSRNHGRRWKYRMFDFKLKAEKGIDHLQDYFKELLDDDDGVKPKIKSEVQEHHSGRKSQIMDSLKFQDDIIVKDIDNGTIYDDDEYHESLEEKDDADSAEPIETTDASVGTSDLNYSQTLIMRIYNPKGLEMFDNLRCRVTYGDKIYDTDLLDKSLKAQEEEDRIEKEALEQLEANVSETVKAKKGLMGRHKNKEKNQTKSVEQIRKDQAERRLRYLARNEEVRIPIPVEVTSGINTDSLYQSLKVTLFSDGKAQNKISQATIDLEELQAMEMQIFKETVYKGDMVTPPSTPDAKPFQNLEPMTYPLYEYLDQVDPNESPSPMGQIPISFFWSRKEDQVVFHRSIETESINRVVEDLTGINLDVVTKEELTREKIDTSVSPRPITPPPETISKSKFDAVISQYEDLIQSIRDKYEQQILDTALAKEVIKEKEISRPTSVYHKDCATSPIFPYRSPSGMRRHPKNESRQNRKDENDKPRSSKSRDTLSTSGPDDQEEIVYFNVEDRKIREEKHDKTRSNYTHSVNDNISGSFLERVSIYSEMSTQHQEELSKKVKIEVSKAIEDKLTELYKLHSELNEEDVAMALSDMCFPAVFMPVTNSSGTVYNPRAHQYFHPISLRNLRLSQPPSIFKLPPIKQNQMSILNLFEIGNEIHIRRLDNANPKQSVGISQAETEKI